MKKRVTPKAYFKNKIRAEMARLRRQLNNENPSLKAFDKIRRQVVQERKKRK